MEVARMQKRQPSLRLLTIALFAVGSIVGCSSHVEVAPAPAHDGYILLNSAGRAAYGLASDSLPETDASHIPSAVRSAATKLAIGDNKDPQCNRYFASGERVVVLMAASCRANEYLADGLALAGFDLSGEAVGRMAHWLSDFVADVKPARRTH